MPGYFTLAGLRRHPSLAAKLAQVNDLARGRRWGDGHAVPVCEVEAAFLTRCDEAE
jgi:hypothetical protein